MSNGLHGGAATTARDAAGPAATSGDWVFGYGSIMNDFMPGDALLARLSPSAGYVRGWNFRSPTGFTAVGLIPQKQSTTQNDPGVCGILFKISSAGNDQSSNRMVGSSNNNNNNRYSAGGSDSNSSHNISSVSSNSGDMHVSASSTSLAQSSSPRSSFLSQSVLSLSALDRREAGYRRVQIDIKSISPITPSDGASVHCMKDSWANIDDACRVWIYVPLPEFSKKPSSDHPICQTYVDTIMRGCLKWGGAELALDWIRTTSGWSEFWLNDAPMSRRPWLHRHKYKEIDAILLEALGSAIFAERRHPEEFSSHWTTSLRGFWGVPPRNPNFIGREKELDEIERSFHGSTDQAGVGITMIETVGLGGVGKTQVAAEYCYRHWKEGSKVERNLLQNEKDSTPEYGLIVWLRAETAEVLGADFRRFAAESGIISVQSARNEDVVAEVLSKLYQSTQPWLMVLDNITDRDSIEAYLPRGSGGGYAGGHVLVTSREFLPGFRREQRVELHCFEMSESLDLLRSAGGYHLEIDEPYRLQHGKDSNSYPASAGPGLYAQSIEMCAGEVLATKLGHLPLALSIAAAYMRQCDVSCGAYIRKLERGVGRRDLGRHQRLAGYPMGVEDSLMLSLNRIQDDDDGYNGKHTRSELMSIVDGANIGMVSAGAVLNTLCYLYPDNISKNIVTTIVECLLLCKDRTTSHNESVNGHLDRGAINTFNWSGKSILYPSLFTTSILAATSLGVVLHGNRRVANLTRTEKVGIVAAAVSVVAVLGATLTRVLVSADTSAFSVQVEEKIGCCSREESRNALLAPSLWHPIQNYEVVTDRYNQTDRAMEHVIGNRSELAHQDVTDLLADHLWIKLKKYSLLTVQSGHTSIHRLLQQLLRLGQENLDQQCISLSTCVWSVGKLWSFDAADASSWASAGQVVDHMQTIGNHVYGTVSRCRAEQERERKLFGQSASRDDRHHHRSRWSLAWELQIRASKLLTESALYMSMALSRFKEAHDVLKIALSIQTDGLLPPVEEGDVEPQTGPGVSLDYLGLSKRLGESLAFTMHTAGKVARYCGQYKEAAQFLHGALQLRGGSMTSLTSSSYDIAATLHELGVLHIKQAEWESARDLLNQSLCMKRGLTSQGHGEEADPETAKAMRFSEEAATLHQLAVVALSSKPRRLDLAESLLREALNVMHNGPFGIGGRAATLQKLAQVLEYQGKRVEARDILDEAMGMYVELYGQGVAHVNVAAVLTSLGNSCFSEKNFAGAKTYLIKSLKMRKKIYGVDNDGDDVCINNNVEIAMNLYKIGEIERAEGNLDTALKYFRKSSQIYNMLLRRECARHPKCDSFLKSKLLSPPVSRRTGSNTLRSLGSLRRKNRRTLIEVLSSMSLSSALSEVVSHKTLRQYITATMWERKIAGDLQDLQTVSILGDDLAELETIWKNLVGKDASLDREGHTSASTNSSSSSSLLQKSMENADCGPCKGVLDEDDRKFSQILMSCRQNVRNAVLKLPKAKSAVNLEQVVEALVECVSPATLVFPKSRNYLTMAAATFMQTIHEACSKSRRDDEPDFALRALRSSVFSACDELRATLRQHGLVISD